MGQAQPLVGWCWALSVVHAQMGPCSYIELRVWRCRTHYSDMPRTSGTHRNTWTDGSGYRHTMLAEYHHCQHLISKQWMIQQFNNIAVFDVDVDPFQKKNHWPMLRCNHNLAIKMLRTNCAKCRLKLHNIKIPVCETATNYYLLQFAIL